MTTIFPEPSGGSAGNRGIIGIFQVVLAALLAINGGITAWNANYALDNRTQTQDNHTAIAVIEQTLFRANPDGLRVWQEIASLQQQITKMQATIPSEFPPERWENRLENRLGSMDKQLQELTLMIRTHIASHDNGNR